MQLRLVTTGLAAAISIVALLAGAQAAAATTQVLTPVADATVRSDRATSNFGTATTLQLDGSPVWNGYLRFDVTVPAGETVTRATFRLYTNQSSGAGFAVHAIAAQTWGETTITYRTAPAIGTRIGAIGSYSANVYADVVVTPLVTASGPVSFALGAPPAG